jgi:hypothetical protein
VIDLENESEDIRSDQIGDEEQKKRLLDANVEGRKNNSIENEKGLSGEEHESMPSRGRIDANGAVHASDKYDLEIGNSELDSEQTVQDGNVEKLPLVMAVPALRGFDSSHIGVVGVDVWVNGVFS